MTINIIKQRLKRIANILLINASFIDNIGLLNGKLGIAIFFFHYSRFTEENIYAEYAGELINEIHERIYQNSNSDYANGLAGIGIGIEYLIQKEFVDANSDEVLVELDKHIQHHTLYHKPDDINLLFGIIGLGKYYSSRLTNQFNNKETDITKLNREYICKIIDMLDTPYNTYFDLLSIIDFLSEVVSLDINSSKVICYLNYAIEKLETMVYEDIHFNVYPGYFNPLSTAVTLIHASDKTGNSEYLNKAVYFLENYEVNFREYLNDDLHSITSGSIKWALLYNHLGIKINNNTYKNFSKKWLKLSLKEKTDELAGFQVEKCNDMSHMGLINGYAGIGLALLNFIEKNSITWLGLIPLYFEYKKNDSHPHLSQNFNIPI